MAKFGDSLRGWVHTGRVLLREWRGVKLEPEASFMDRFLAPDALCLHIGASDGRHAFRMARLVPRGTVHCIEASRYTVAVLARLRRLLSLPNLRIHNLAIGAADGQVTLVTPIKANGHRGRAFAFISEAPLEEAASEWDRRFVGFENEPVPLMTLDSFCAAKAIGRVDFLRCDIEGAEILMLDGGRTTLARDRPVIMMEVHPFFLAQRFGRSAAEVWDCLAGQDYHMFYLRDGALAATDGFFEEPWRDYFCVPAERLADYGLD